MFAISLTCSLLLTTAAAGAAPCATPYDSTRDYFAGYKAYTPTNATGFSIAYGRDYKTLRVVNSAGGFFVTTISVCGAPLPAASSLGLGPSDTLVSQLSAPLTTAGLTSVSAPRGR
jgi:hypothetical protein